jgi:Tol biopolymer transport system component
LDSFSADGKEVYYTRLLNYDIWAVQTLGGSPRRVVSGLNLLPLPDGTSFIYTKLDSPGIFRVGKSGLNEELVYKSDDLDFFPLLVFPGGNDLLAGAGRAHWPNVRFFRISLTSHEAVDLGEIPFVVDVAWAEPGNSILLSREVDGLTNIWKYGLRDRSLTQITFGIGVDYSPMPDPGGKGIYYLNGSVSQSLTAYHVQSKQSIDIVPEGATQPIISLDGKRVMYTTLPISGKVELWTSDIHGGNKVKITTSEAREADLLTLNWAPDSFHLSFSQGPKLYIVGADGSGLRQLPSMEGMTISNAVWNPDQKSVYVSALEGSGITNTIWKWSEGSNPEKLVEKCGFAYDIDPGGKYLLALADGVYEVPISEGKCISLFRAASNGAFFAPDGKSLLYAVASPREVDIYRQPWREGNVIGTSQVALTLPFNFYLGFGEYDFSRDLSTIVYERSVYDHADLYLLSPK